MNAKNFTEQSFFGPDYRKVDIGQVARVAQDKALMLDCGAEVKDVPIAYQTYGTLNADKSNAILICHALTGDQFVLGKHPVTGRSGWWESLVGPGKVVDTNVYFVICSNVIGSCMGSFGPKHTELSSNKAYGTGFPVITIGDMVKAQCLLIDHLGIERLFAVIGGSMGGMQVLEWASRYPERMHAAIPLATSANHSAQNIAFHEIGRQAIMADANWHGGHYYEHNAFPERGLAIARMTAHVTYLSEQALTRKFGRNLQDRSYVSFGFEADFQVESYLRHQGRSFVDRFDPNSYLYITRAMDYFDLFATGGGQLSAAFPASDVRFCIISFSSDWLFPTSEARTIVQALNARAANVSFVEVETDKGHDAFLLEEPDMFATIRGFLHGTANAVGVTHAR